MALGVKDKGDALIARRDQRVLNVSTRIWTAPQSGVLIYRAGGYALGPDKQNGGPGRT